MEYPQPVSQSTREEIEHGLSTCAVFLDWPKDRLRELANAARARHYRRRTPLVSRGNHQREVFVVVSGSIEIAATNAAGDKYILSVLGAGQITRMVHLIDDMQPIFAFDARADSHIIHIPGAAMRRILDAEPVLWRSIAQTMLRRYRMSAEILQDQVLGSVRRRTAITLLNMVYRYGDESGSPHDTELRISQTDLANMLGVSRQTIGKELAQLKDEGVLGCNEGYRLITVVDLPKLHRITAED